MPAVQTVAFTGTKTGNKYTVGQSYSMGGQSFRANADGSFTKEATGRNLVGSSRDPNVTFYVKSVGSDAGAGAAGGRKSPVTRSVSSGPGSDAAVTSPGVLPGSGPGVPAVRSGSFGPGVFLNTSPVVLDVQKPRPVTQVVISGANVIHDRGWSDAAEVEQRYGEAEFLSPSYFYGWGVTFADFKKSVIEPEWQKFQTDWNEAVQAQWPNGK